jgi:thioredoxin 1
MIMKKFIVSMFVLMFAGFAALAQKTENLTESAFKQKVYDFDKNKVWKYAGNTPAIIDFYADWCAPCRQVAPVLEQLASEYGTKIKIYKVNTDNNPRVANAFKIRGIPAFLFIPASGEPKMMVGAMPKADFEKEINNFLKVKK